MRFETSAGALVFKTVHAKPSVLLINFDFEGRNIWGFPKGHIKKDEVAPQTAKREVKEETNIDIEIVSAFEEVVRFQLVSDNVRNRQVFYYIGKPLSSYIIPESETIKTALWIQVDIAMKLLTFQSDKDVLKKALIWLEI